jgi:hypothetical protein
MTCLRIRPRTDAETGFGLVLSLQRVLCPGGVCADVVDDVLALLMGQPSVPEVQQMAGLDLEQAALDCGGTAQPVIDALKDAEDYAAFEMAVTAECDAQSAVERELVLRMASLLWRLRRARRSSCLLVRESTACLQWVNAILCAKRKPS